MTIAVVLASLVCPGCAGLLGANRPPDQRWADAVCTALGRWSSAQTSGASSGTLRTLHDEGRLTHRSMAAALRPGAAAAGALAQAVRDAGSPPVPDAPELTRRLDAMVTAEILDLRQAYAIARDRTVPVAVAYAQVERRLAALERADEQRAIVNLRWHDVPSCQALV